MKAIRLLLSLLLLPAVAPAANLLLDFGPTVCLPADATKDPAHAVGAVPGTEITWNTITADTNTLYYANGSAATGVTLDLGRSTAGSDTINFSDNGFTVNALGGSVSTGVYAGTSPVRDGIFGGSGGANNLAVGLKVSGLPAGTYTLYVHGRNTSAGGIASVRFYATNGPSAASYSFTMNDATVFITNSTPALTLGFLENDNFGVMTVNLTAGDSLYVACEGTIASELRGFFNAITIFGGVPVLPVRVTAQPASKSVYEGVNVSFATLTSGTPPLTNQWRLNGTNNLVDGPTIFGSKSNTLNLKPVTVSMAGNYTLAVSNATGFDISSNATLTVTSLLNTDQMTNMWSLSPGDRPYLGTGSTERGLAFNPLTTNLLLVSRLSADPAVVVLDALTGAEKYFLNVAGIPTTTAGVSLGLNTIGVADDGAVYAASVTTTASSPAFNIYKWPDDSASSTYIGVFAGDPGASTPQANLAWTDSMIVRGAGVDTQILISPRTSTNVALLRTMSGSDFQTEIPPTLIAVSGVPTNFARLGLAWGPGTNTFWAKNSGGQLFLIQFDLNAATGAVVQAYSTTVVPSAVRGLATDSSRKFLAGMMLESLGDNVRLYDVSDLVVGPILRDQEVFVTQNNNVNGTAAFSFGNNMLFALDTDNGIKAFFINTNYVPPSVSIVANPANRTAMEGATVTFTALAAGTQPLFHQWKFNGTNNVVNGPNISGANTNVLVLRNITTNSAGNYSLFVSNAFGTATSSNAVLTVLPTFNTAQMSNIWNLLPGDRTYFGTNSTERGLAFNSVTTNLLVVSRAGPDPTVVVLNPATGAEKNFLDVTGIPTTVAGLSLGLNTIGVADDGVVFGASVTISATAPAFNIYRWPNDSAGNPNTLVFAGDPGAAAIPNLRYTDAMIVRGAGANTQILISPGSGTNVVMLRSSSGLDFQTEIPPAVINVTGVPGNFAQLGLAWGPGTNTFWAKNVNSSLYLIQFDLNSNTAFVLREYGTNSVVSTFRGISVDKNQKFVAGLSTEISSNVRLYEVSDLNAGPILRDQEVFATLNPNVTLGGTGGTAFGGNYVFALDSNNGLKAFLINTNFVPPLSSFPITSVSQNSASVILTWHSVAGHQYQVQSRNDIATGSWGNLGSPITASGTSTSATNPVSGNIQFYRVQGQ